MNGTPENIGPYEIIREIGRGGMGVVYLATHPTLGIEVALKALYPDPSRQKDDEVMRQARKRFENEAKVTARLKDPHIIKIYDFGADEETGILYIVMDYLDGGTLKDKLAEKGKFTLEETLDIIKPIAKALDKIHKQGIIHRDLKPSNILFIDDTPVITDFGIAKDILTTLDTETGRLVGSVPYMSPERINELEYDHRADVYSLGVIIYEMLQGQNPFRADTHLGILNNVANLTLPDLATVVPGLPSTISGVILSMIDKNPDSRLASLKNIQNLEPNNTRTEKLSEELKSERKKREQAEKQRKKAEQLREKEKEKAENLKKELDAEKKKKAQSPPEKSKRKTTGRKKSKIVREKKERAEKIYWNRHKHKDTYEMLIVIPIAIIIFIIFIGVGFKLGQRIDNEGRPDWVLWFGAVVFAALPSMFGGALLLKLAEFVVKKWIESARYKG